MPTKAMHPAGLRHDSAPVGGSFAICAEALYPDAPTHFVGFGAEALYSTAWISSGSACSESARSVEERLADVLSEATHLGAALRIWGFLLADPALMTSAEVEFDELLPSQPRLNHRVVAGVVHRSKARWSDIALSDDELDAIYVESGDG